MQAFYLQGDAGRRFCLFHPAEGAEARGAVLYLHPFAEELNKSRRLVAMQARALAEAGYAVLQIDLAGCGDSAGDFADADWQSWLADVELACRWLRERSDAPLTLWGLRLGCLLAVEAAARLPETANFLFWQPVISGKQHWQQFMRLKLAGELLAGSGKEILSEPANRLMVGEPVEVAGYTVNAQLAHAITQADLQPPPCPARLSWLEISSRQESELLPVSQKCLEQWRAGGFLVDARVVNGPAFWQTAEIEEVQALLEATLQSLAGNA